MNIEYLPKECGYKGEGYECNSCRGKAVVEFVCRDGGFVLCNDCFIIFLKKLFIFLGNNFNFNMDG